MKIFESLESIRIGSVSLASICWAALLLIICLIVRKLVLRIFSRAVARTRLDRALVSFLRSAVSIVLWILTIIIVADKLGIPMTSLVALMSIVGLALSLSVQNTLENLFSGMTLLTTKPFSAGDYVDIGTTSGSVVSVGLFYTRLTTIDGKQVSLPNKSVTSAQITNYSANEKRRVDLSITASYEDDPEDVKAALLEAVDCTPGVIMEPAPITGVINYGTSSIEYQLLVWVETPRFREARFSILENIGAKFQKYGITMTYDHLNVHIVEK